MAVTIAALTLGLVAACSLGGSGRVGSAGGADDSSSGVPPAPPATTPRTVSPSQAGQAGPDPVVIDPVAGHRERRLPWTMVRSDGRELVVAVRAGGPPCDAITGVEARESAERVVLIVWSGRVPAAAGCDDPQPALLGTFWVRVPLAAPVGDRAVTPG